MQIRTYQPGDESAQVEIFNLAAGPLPKFKPATVDEVRRRYRADGFDPSTRFYAVHDGRVVGYAGYDFNGRISYPWCLSGAEEAQGPLLDAVVFTMQGRRVLEAWAAYRSDWSAVLRFFEGRGFVRAREMINYVGEAARMPRAPVPQGQAVTPLSPEDLPRLLDVGSGIIRDDAPELLEAYFWKNPDFGPESLFALKPADRDELLGVALLIVNAGYADPTRIDPLMPCFRLGALGTERERHKRVNGMFSCTFEDESAGTVLLSEAARRLAGAGTERIAAQAPSDQPELCAFYDRYFDQQGTFPILSRRLREG